MGIVFITHFLDQVYEISDRITVLRNGKLVGTYETSSLSRIELIAKMIGRKLVELNEMSKVKLESITNEGETLLQAEQLGHTGVVEPFDMELRSGEVLGFAGLLGSGRTEIAYLLFGVDKPDSGKLVYEGKEVRVFRPWLPSEEELASAPKTGKQTASLMN